jgi:hypothetical protein
LIVCVMMRVVNILKRQTTSRWVKIKESSLNTLIKSSKIKSSVNPGSDSEHRGRDRERERERLEKKK